MKQKTVEEQYKKMSQIEHILQRPDTYIGSIQRQKEPMWIFHEQKIISKEIEYVPGFYKIFDEILVNASDNYQRDKSMSYLKVEINDDLISIANDGKPIPVQIHKEHNIYVPELIFGVLLTGSNYDDNEKRVVGGRNGFGAKLTNIYSKEFIVEISDGVSHYEQAWKDNMSIKCIPLLNQKSAKNPFVKISFRPDYKRFNMQGMEADTYALLQKRVYDVAGIFGAQLRVAFNNERIRFISFARYIDMYLPNDAVKIYDEQMDNPRWQVVVAQSPTQFQQVSFVNGISTNKGGTHITYVTDKIITDISEELMKNKKSKGVDIQKYQIKNQLWVFVNCLIDNPSFDSQTKETLTTKVSEYGGTAKEKFVVSEKFIKQILKTDIIESIINQAKAKQDQKLNKHMKGGKANRIHGIEKLDDANDAGKKNSELCTLILTEGDSAKALAMSGIDVIGRDRYGVFPLKGKLLNVREATAAQIMQNEEIENLIKIIGLQKGKDYTDLKSLRYGSIMIMTDQDTDGSHIKGLIINFIHHFWPSLFRFPGFLKEFVTPLIKVSKGNQKIPFFTVQDYKKFIETNNMTGWHTKYYKGLGTSDDDEAQEYFRNLNTHQIEFVYLNQEEDDSVDLCFNKKRADDRKRWLTGYNSEIFVDHTQRKLRYYDFVHKEMIHFSMSDTIRSIPSVMDGFKPSQRKVLFASFKRNLKQELKVVQLGGYIAEHAAYHHGDISLTGTIVGMAQNFVGSNNINLLMPNGQFGSRYLGGKDHASARYISTQLNKLSRFIFPEADDHSLEYLEDDGTIVEPRYYQPIIPMVLVNGSDGIGTGWSTSIPNYCPKELAQQIKNKLSGGEFYPQVPHYRNFEGTIVEKKPGTYICSGIVEGDEETDVVKITELPVGKWTKQYKDGLDKELIAGDPYLDMREYHTKHKIHFEVQMAEGFVAKCNDLVDKFKLNGVISTTNMYLFDSNGSIRKYEKIEDILEEFFQVRLKAYQLRKNYLLSKLDREVEIMNNKVRFIKMFCSGELEVRNVKSKVLFEVMMKKGFTKFSELIQVRSTKLKAFAQTQKKIKDEEDSEDDAGVKKEVEEVNELTEYKYLLSMPIQSLTQEKVLKLIEECRVKTSERKAIADATLEQMWTDDLDKFLVVLDEVWTKEQEIINKGEKMKGKKNKPMKMNKPQKEEAKEQIKKPRVKKQNSNEIEDDIPVVDNKSKKSTGSSVFKKELFKNPKQQNEIYDLLNKYQPAPTGTNEQKYGPEYGITRRSAEDMGPLFLYEDARDQWRLEKQQKLKQQKDSKIQEEEDPYAKVKPKEKPEKKPKGQSQLQQFLVPKNAADGPESKNDVARRKKKTIESDDEDFQP